MRGLGLRTRGALVALGAAAACALGGAATAAASTQTLGLGGWQVQSNALAIEVVPNDPTKMLTLDDVDWNQIPPDNNTGIQFPVQLHTARALALNDAHVVQHDSLDASHAAVTVKGTVKNVTASAQTGV